MTTLNALSMPRAGRLLCFGTNMKILWILVALLGAALTSTATLAASTVAAESPNAAHAEVPRGPHGGWLLRDGDVTLELAIYEDGVPPRFHAWIEKGGKPAADARLEVTLKRLRGQQDSYAFTRADGYWLGAGVVYEPHSFDLTATLLVDGKAHRWNWASYEGRVTIPADIVAAAGMTTAVAGPGVIERRLRVYGRLVMPTNQQTRVRARFPGVIESVSVQVGERIDKGAVLARIEADASLQSYTMRAPIAGQVQAQSASVGEVTGDAPLFTLVDTRTLWAELQVFPTQRAAVAVGQTAIVQSGEHRVKARIASITPAGGGKPYVVARVVLDNADHKLAPGELVSADIVVEEVKVPLAVDKRALQTVHDWRVVFVKSGDTYELRPLKLGRIGERYAEVLNGLRPGAPYVVRNSYLIKADVLKSGAKHAH